MGRVEDDAEVPGITAPAIPAASNGRRTGADALLVAEAPGHRCEGMGGRSWEVPDLPPGDVNGDGVGVIGVVRLGHEGAWVGMRTLSGPFPPTMAVKASW